MMQNQPHHPNHIGTWWWRTGEPVALSLLLLAALTIPLLLVAGMLHSAQVAPAMLGLLLVAAALLLPRLPRVLHSESRRLGAVGIVSAIALLVATLNTTTPATQAEPALHQDGAPQEQGLTFKSPPRISREMFAQLLQQGIGGTGTSPAAPEADALYDILLRYELDPAVAMAIFAKESQFCTTGLCARHDMHNWGGNRAAYDPSRAVDTVYNSTGPFVSYASWEDGLSDWCELILNRYIGRGLDTVEKGIPVYAPAFDGNDPDDYIATVRRLVARWREQDPGQILVTSNTYADLETGLLSETFRATGQEYNPEWAFHNYMLEEARQGRWLGSPLDESRYITVDGKNYAIQTFAFDTLYTPLASIESNTNWDDVRRLSDLLYAGPPGVNAGPGFAAPSDASAAPSAPAAPAVPTATSLPTAVPSETSIPLPPVQTVR